MNLLNHGIMFPGARKIVFAIQRKVTDDNVRGEVNPRSPIALKAPGYYVVRCMMSLGSALGRLQFSDQLKPDLLIAAVADLNGLLTTTVYIHGQNSR
jgi:hypothetical protein